MNFFGFGRKHLGVELESGPDWAREVDDAPSLTLGGRAGQWESGGAVSPGNDRDVAVDHGAAPGGPLEKVRHQAPSLAEKP